MTPHPVFLGYFMFYRAPDTRLFVYQFSATEVRVKAVRLPSHFDDQTCDPTVRAGDYHCRSIAQCVGHVPADPLVSPVQCNRFLVSDLAHYCSERKARYGFVHQRS